MMHPHWPLTPGSWIEYVMFDISGPYNPATGEIGITSQTIRPKTFWTTGPRMRTTCVADPNAQIPAIRRINSEPGTPPGSSFKNMGLYEGPWYPTALDKPVPPFIGESGGVNFTCTPPEPKLTMNPVAGETFSLTCRFRGYATEPDSSQYAGDINCRYLTRHVAQPWGPYTDTVRTHLIERPGEAHEIAYNYVFQRGVGPVDWWWGIVYRNPDGTHRVEGWRLWAERVSA